MPTPRFEPDAQVAKVAQAYSLDAVDLAAKNFGITLDWSESSIQQVETMLARLHDEMSSAQPSEDTVWIFAKAFGSYIGEVMRRQHGYEWGVINWDGDSFPGLRQLAGGLIWPWSKAHKRLKNGPEDNVWHYCKIVIKDDVQPSDTPHPQMPSQEPTRKPWWKLW